MDKRFINLFFVLGWIFCVISSLFLPLGYCDLHQKCGEGIIGFGFCYIFWLVVLGILCILNRKKRTELRMDIYRLLTFVFGILAYIMFYEGADGGYQNPIRYGSFIYWQGIFCLLIAAVPGLLKIFDEIKNPKRKLEKKLIELKLQYEKGLITEEEYKACKAKILDI